MRLTIIVFLGFILSAAAQELPTLEKFKEVAKLEERAHGSIAALKTSANSSTFDIHYLKCYWEADPGQRYIKGEISTHFQSMVNSLDSIQLELSDSLTVDSIKSHQANLNFQHINDVISIELPISLVKGAFDSIQIYYQGIPPTSGFGSFEVDSHAGVPVMWTLSQPYGSKDWWPCKNGLTDKIDSLDIFIRTPSTYKAGSNGLLVNTSSSNGMSTYHWKHNYPIAPYLIAFAITNYSEFNLYVPNGMDSIPILHYVYPEDSANSHYQSQAIYPIMSVFDSLFGDYPFADEKYGHCQVSWGGGMEHQTFSFMGSLFFELVAHEAAHQWFGDKVTCGSWEDIWLNEGWATYLTALVYEKVSGGIFWMPYLTNLNTLVTDEPDGSVWVDDTTSVSRIFNPRLSYAKGALVLHQLRWVIGDSAFFSAANAYLNDTSNAFSYSNTPNLISHFENASGQNLSWYFDDWFTGEGFPSYQVTWSHFNDSLYIKLDQTQSDASVSFFELPVPVQVYSPSKDSTLRLDNTFSGQTYKIYYPFNIHTINIDPEYWLISANHSYTIGISESKLPVFFKAYPNPTSSRVELKFQSSLENGKIILFDGSGRTLWSIENIKSNQVDLDVSELENGMYFLWVEEGNSSYSEKLIIQR